MSAEKITGGVRAEKTTDGVSAEKTTEEEESRSGEEEEEGEDSAEDKSSLSWKINITRFGKPEPKCKCTKRKSRRL